MAKEKQEEESKEKIRESVDVENSEEVGKEERVKAQKLFQEGYKAYQKQDYTTAVSLWRQAYEYVPEAVFLFNAARAAEKLGNLSTAEKLAEQAKAKDNRTLSAEDAAKNEQLLQRVSEKQKYRESKEAWKREKKLDWRAVSGFAAVGVGVGGIISAGLVGREAQRINNDLAEARTRPEYRNLTDTFQARQNLGRGLLYSGIGLAAAGASFVVWDLVDVPEKPDKPKFSVGVNARNGLQGVFRLKF
jgi:tetratricopeptide (TPR) repeat protein